MVDLPILGVSSIICPLAPLYPIKNHHKLAGLPVKVATTWGKFTFLT